MKKIQFKQGNEKVYPVTGNTSTGNKLFPIADLSPKNVKINIVSNLLAPNIQDNTIYPLTISKNTVGDLEERNVIMHFTSDSINFEDAITIAYQGNSTLNNPKKGFGIDVATKRRFKNWISFDSFHLKGYYIDWTHTRDICSNILLEQIMNSRDKIRPYEYYNDFGEDYYKSSVENGALCHIDSFPVDLSINGVYWGLYSFTSKKSNSNYFLSKKDVHNIMFEPDNNAYITTSGWDWTKIEIRCPKSKITNMDGTPYDGDNPTEIAAGDVKTSILNFISFVSNISYFTTKEELSEHINLENFIDWYIFNWVIDNIDIVGKNTLYTTWDGIHWSLCSYDFDNTYGMYAWETGDAQHSPTYDTYAHKANTLAPWVPIIASILNVEIKKRYAELRDLGIVSIENIKNIFNSKTKEIGADAYEKDLNRWDYPSYGKSSANFVFSTKKIYSWFEGRLTFLDNKFDYNQN